jgi:hypothetical protein
VETKAMSFDGDACSAACGWCGRCTYGRYRDADFGDDDTPSVCDLPNCGEPVRVTFAGVGQFCSGIIWSAGWRSMSAA